MSQDALAAPALLLAVAATIAVFASGIARPAKPVLLGESQSDRGHVGSNYVRLDGVAHIPVPAPGAGARMVLEVEGVPALAWRCTGGHFYIANDQSGRNSGAMEFLGTEGGRSVDGELTESGLLYCRHDGGR